MAARYPVGWLVCERTRARSLLSGDPVDGEKWGVVDINEDPTVPPLSEHVSCSYYINSYSPPNFDSRALVGALAEIFRSRESLEFIPLSWLRVYDEKLSQCWKDYAPGFTYRLYREMIARARVGKEIIFRVGH